MTNLGETKLTLLTACFDAYRLTILGFFSNATFTPGARAQSRTTMDQLRKTAFPDLVPVSVINKAVLGGKICDEELRREDDHQTDLIIVLLVPEYVPLLEDAH